MRLVSILIVIIYANKQDFSSIVFNCLRIMPILDLLYGSADSLVISLTTPPRFFLHIVYVNPQDLTSAESCQRTDKNKGELIMHHPPLFLLSVVQYDTTDYANGFSVG